MQANGHDISHSVTSVKARTMRRVNCEIRTGGGVEEGDLFAGIDVARSSDVHVGHIQVDKWIATVIHEHLMDA